MEEAACSSRHDYDEGSQRDVERTYDCIGTSHRPVRNRLANWRMGPCKPHLERSPVEKRKRSSGSLSDHLGCYVRC
jgi:hypothetical protein